MWRPVNCKGLINRNNVIFINSDSGWGGGGSTSAFRSNRVRSGLQELVEEAYKRRRITKNESNGFTGSFVSCIP